MLNKNLLSLSTFFILWLVLFSCQENEKRINNTDALYSFSKLYGYVKYFHPSDEAAEIDWDLFAIYGAKRVQEAKTQKELKEILEELFLPIAPSLQISFEEEELFFNHNALISPVPSDTVSWQYLGYPSDFGENYYKKVRINTPLVASYEDKFYDYYHYTNSSPFEADSLQISFNLIQNTHNWRSSTDYGLFLLDSTQQWNYQRLGTLLGGKSVSVDTTIFLEKEYQDVLLFYRLYGKVKIGIDNILLDLISNKNIRNKSLYSEDFDQNLSNYNNIKASNEYYQVEVQKSEFSKSNLLTIKSSNPIVQKKSLPIFKKQISFGEYFEKDIGNQLKIIYPLALLRDTNGTYPKSNHMALKSLNEELKMLNLNSPSSIKVGNLIVLWNTFKHFYPYTTIQTIDWNKILKDLIDSSLNSELTEIEILKLLVHELKDGHGSVYHVNEMDYYYPLSVDLINNEVIISEITNDSLSYLLGSKILEINGDAIGDLISEKQHFISASSTHLIEKKAANSLFVSIDAEPIRLTVITETGETKQINIFPDLNDTAESIENQIKGVTKLDKDLYYLNLKNTRLNDFTKKYQEISKSGYLIIDGRGYPNTDAKKILEYFIDENDTIRPFYVPEVIYPDYDKKNSYKREGWDLVTKDSSTYMGNVYYLVDNTSISYSESIGSFFENMGNVTIVGQSSAGANGNVVNQHLLGGFVVRWTGMKFLKHDGTQFHGIGITPDVYVERTPEGIAAGRDEVLEKAIELARGN